MWAAAVVCCGLVASAGAQTGTQEKADLPQAPVPNLAKLPGGVVVEQGDRRGTAERGVYTAVDEKFVLSGGTPTLFDPVQGTTTGRELTFYRADDTIVVDSGNGLRTLTKHRVQR